MTQTPPGWYDDGRGALRWWDGAAWSEHVAEPGNVTTDADDALPPELAELGTDETSGGAFAAATAPQKSRLWILWVVLGVVLLGIVIAAAVAIPLLFLSLASRAGGAVAPQGAAQEAAVEAVHDYSDAWLDGDCDDYFDATTEAFQQLEGIASCADFEEASPLFAETVTDYRVTITGVTEEGGAIEVETREDYGALVDLDGEPVAEPEPYQDVWTYVLVPVGDDWAIDEVR